jgi:hypothetical protein
MLGFEAMGNMGNGEQKLSICPQTNDFQVLNYRSPRRRWLGTGEHFPLGLTSCSPVPYRANERGTKGGTRETIAGTRNIRIVPHVPCVPLPDNRAERKPMRGNRSNPDRVTSAY